MLLLTRRPDESLIIEVDGIDEVIEIRVLEINNQVRLGVTAPQQCKIWRTELYQTIQMNRKSTAELPAKNVRSIAHKLINDFDKNS